MTDFVKYLIGIKAKLGVSSDRQLAAKIGISQSHVCNIMSGTQIPTDDICVKIAELAGENPERVILLAHKSKASDRTRSYWEHIFNLLPEPKKAAVAASLALFLALPFCALGGSDFSLHNVNSVYLMRHCFAVFLLLLLMARFAKSTLPSPPKTRHFVLSL